MRRHRAFVAEWGWEEIVPASGTEPSMNRGGALFVKDGTDFILIGGQRENFSGDTYLGDVWTYSTTSNTWTQVLASGLTNGSNDYISRSFIGYADGSGNAYRGPTSAGGKFYKIAKSSGAETDLGVAAVNVGFSCADIANNTLYGLKNSADKNPGETLHKVKLTTTTATSTSLTSAVQTTRNGRSSLALYPAGNTLYMFAPEISATLPQYEPWTLGTGDIIKYDLTAGTGWVAETGVTNAAGSIGMGTIQGQLVWVASESKFFFLGGSGSYSIGTVLSYDPASKVIAQVLFDGSPTTYLAAQYCKGNAGSVIVENSDIYVIRNSADYSLRNEPARIWKFRRN